VKLCFRYDPSKRPTADEALKFILDLNVKDGRPSIAAEHKTIVKRPRLAAEIDYDTLVSIVQQVRTPF
jgi:hypothetical protein